MSYLSMLTGTRIHEKGEVILHDWLKHNGFDSPLSQLTDEEIDVIARLTRAKSVGDIFVFRYNPEIGKKEYLIVEVKTCTPQYWRQAVLLAFAQACHYRYVAHREGLDSPIKLGVGLLIDPEEWLEEQEIGNRPLYKRLRDNLYLDFLRDFGVTLFIVDVKTKHVEVVNK